MRILLIDDDPDELEILKEGIKGSLQISFFLAESCEEAIKSVATFNPNLILVDLHLGMLSGIDCLKRLKVEEATSRIPVIMFSTSKMKHHIDASYDAGADYFFVKPDSITKISNIINQLTEIDWSQRSQVTRSNFVLRGN